MARVSAPPLVLLAMLGVVVTTVATAGCDMLSSGLPDRDASPGVTSADAGIARAEAPLADGATDTRVVEPPGIFGDALAVGCSDQTREGFRDVVVWPQIAGCAGGFSRPGVLVTGGLRPTCDLQAGDTGPNPTGIGCSAADLCAAGWHVCVDGTDVANHSPTGDCEGCVGAGEARFFLVASGASSMGVCTTDRSAGNDLHGCGGLGEPESVDCAPLDRRMGFADCLNTENVWFCGTAEQNLQEATMVTKSGPTMGGVLCCLDD